VGFCGKHGDALFPGDGDAGLARGTHASGQCTVTTVSAPTQANQAASQCAHRQEVFHFTQQHAKLTHCCEFEPHSLFTTQNVTLANRHVPLLSSFSLHTSCLCRVAFVHTTALRHVGTRQTEASVLLGIPQPSCMFGICPATSPQNSLNSQNLRTNRVWLGPRLLQLLAFGSTLQILAFSLATRLLLSVLALKQARAGGDVLLAFIAFEIIPLNSQISKEQTRPLAYLCIRLKQRALLDLTSTVATNRSRDP
jgi:hypothetical protein